MLPILLLLLIHAMPVEGVIPARVYVAMFARIAGLLLGNNMKEVYWLLVTGVAYSGHLRRLLVNVVCSICFIIFFFFSDPRIMKVLLGLLGYSCKIHRKRSKSSINRLSFTESDEHKFERSISNEDTFSSLQNNTDNANKAISSDTEPSTSTSSFVQNEESAESGEKLQNSSNQDKPEDELADQVEGKL